MIAAPQSLPGPPSRRPQALAARPLEVPTPALPRADHVAWPGSGRLCRFPSTDGAVPRACGCHDLPTAPLAEGVPTAHLTRPQIHFQPPPPPGCSEVLLNWRFLSLLQFGGQLLLLSI